MSSTQISRLTMVVEGSRKASFTYHKFSRYIVMTKSIFDNRTQRIFDRTALSGAPETEPLSQGMIFDWMRENNIRSSDCTIVYKQDIEHLHSKQEYDFSRHSNIDVGDILARLGTHNQ